MTNDSHARHYLKALRCVEREEWYDCRFAVSKAIDLSDPETPWHYFLVKAWALLKVADDDWWEQQDILDTLYQSDKAANGSSPDCAALIGYALFKREQPAEALPYLFSSLGRTSLIPACSVINGADLVALLCEALAAQLEELEKRDLIETSIIQATEILALVEASPSAAATVKKYLRAEVLATRAFCYCCLGDSQNLIADLASLRLADPEHPRIQTLSPRVDPHLAAVSSISHLPAVLDFSQVAGSDEKGTFTHTLRRLYRLHFSDKAAIANPINAILQHKSASSYLVYGPSGCGKTYAISAFAGQHARDHGYPLPIIRMRLNDLMGKWVGESEKAITAVIDEAIEKAPCILFADEMEALGQGRSSSGPDWRNTQVAHMLQELDRLKASGRNIIFFGSTNHLQMLDFAIMRRFDQIIPADMPDESVRRRIFEIHLQNHPEILRPTTLDWNDLLTASHGLTPGDIERAVSKAFDDCRSKILDDEDQTVHAMPYATLSSAVHEQDPHHVREWLAQSVRTLRQHGYEDRAKDLEAKYDPYVRKESSSPAISSSSVSVAALPTEAWDEKLVFG